MKFNFSRLIFLFSLTGIISSCLPTTTTPVATSTDASFVSLTLAGNDSVNKAVFVLNADGKTIENIDSLPFKTRIDSVYPTFNFKSSAGAFLHLDIKNPKIKFTKGKVDSTAISGKDTVDFRQPLLPVSNFASDGKAYKLYYIKTNVHKVDPELYIWSNITGNVSSVNAINQKAVILNDIIYYFMNNGTTAYLSTSTDGSSWSSQTVNGLPFATPLNDMILFNGKLFVSQDGYNLYSSANGTVWTMTQPNTGFTFKSLAFALNNQLWAVVKSVNDGSYHFAISTDGVIWNMTTGTTPTNFPVNDFAANTFSTITGKQKVVVLGGYSSNGTTLKNNWSSEDGVYWVDFSTENHTLDSLAVGASVISYDKKLLLFGKNNSVNKTIYRESKDEGLSWQVPDTLRNSLPKTFPVRSYQSAVVDKNNKIFIIGGNTGTSVLTDVWTGKVNRKSFLLQ